jgi:signal transduction histidine kinase
MKTVVSWYSRAKDFVVTYPAVLSGYVIYAYLFISIIRFMLLARYAEVATFEAIEIFLPLPFMWLLAVSLVKVIEVRTRLHESERRRMQDAQELEMKRVQLDTLREVVRGVQHQINDPLAIAILSTDKLKQNAADMGKVLTCADDIGSSIRRIADAVVQFTRMEAYRTGSVGPGAGNLVVPDLSPDTGRAGYRRLAESKLMPASDAS